MNDEHPDDGARWPASLQDEAALWFARMRGEHAEEIRPEFETWLGRGALHMVAYNRIADVFAAGKMLKAEADAARAVRRRRLALAGKIAAVAGLTFLVGFGAGHLQFSATTAPSFITAANAQTITRIGQIARLRLADGTPVVLDTDTLLVSRVGGVANVARLDRGRARFTITNARPALIVRAARTEWLAHDAIFDLSVASDGAVAATIISGSVELRSARANATVAAASRMVAPSGSRLLIDEAGNVGRDFERGGALWPQGILEFREAPLDDVLAQANRYAIVKLGVADHDTGRLRVSGRFRVDDPAGLARRLALALGLTVERSAPDALLLERGV